MRKWVNHFAFSQHHRHVGTDGDFGTITIGTLLLAFIILQKTLSRSR